MDGRTAEGAGDAATVQEMEADTARPEAGSKSRPINAPHRRRPSLERLRARTGIGHLAPIFLASAIGLALCSLANALSRATLSPSQLIFWAGIVAIALPIAHRLTSRDASARERLVLVCLLGLSLYAVKLTRDAPLFTFADEIVHAYNLEQIGRESHLFGSNPILRVTPSYPGLEGATSALTQLTGISSYAAGAIIVGAARLCLMAGLFLLFGRLSGSARSAGLGAAIYAGNFNFLYWGVQYSYESLALPLLVVVMMVLAEREAGPRRWAREWAVPVTMGTAAIVITHHLTSYALAIFIAALALTYWLLRRSWSWSNPWRYAVLASGLAIAWLLLVASSTVGYIAPVLGEAFESIFDTIFGEESGRTLFEGENPPGEATPTIARGAALLSVALLGIGLLFGLREVWRRYRSSPFAVVLAIAGIGFFGTLALRFTPAAWETGNRASEFLYIGLAFVVAVAGFETWRTRFGPRIWRAVLSGAIALVIAGGAISGWPWEIQLASPMKIKAEGRTIVSPPLALAEWARDNTSANARFAATPADARMLMVPGGRTAFAGQAPDIEDILNTEGFSGWELPLLARRDIHYIVTDRREIANDAVSGYFFPVAGETERNALVPKAYVAKFGEIPGAARVYTNGPIAVYDLRGVEP